MKVLVTGATGLIGRALIPVLNENKISTLILNRNFEKALSLFPPEEYPFIHHATSTSWETVISFNPEYVIHLAGLSTSQENMDIIPDLIESNITFGVYLLEALSKCSDLKLFINASSFSEYRNDQLEVDCAYLYSASKNAFRSFLDYFSSKYGFKIIYAVLYSVYGGATTVKRITDYIIESIGAKEKVKMSPGYQILDFIHVNDVIAFFLASLKCNINDLNRVNQYYVGTGVGTSIRQLVSIVEEISQKECNVAWGAFPYRDRDIMRAIAPSTQSFDVVQWKPYVTIEAGIKELLENKKTDN